MTVYLKGGGIVILLAICAAPRCDFPRFPKTELFEPDLKVLEAEVQEMYRKERARDADGLLRHWEPCLENYEADLSPVRNARFEARVRLAAPPPENPRCTYKVAGYGSRGRFVDAHCRLQRGGVQTDEMIGFVALYPSARSQCKFLYSMFMYRPRLRIPD